MEDSAPPLSLRQRTRGWKRLAADARDRRPDSWPTRSSRRARTRALGELIQPIEQAKEAGADAIVTPCPLCHLSLDAWQSKLKKQTGKDFQMPILHLSQLIGVAAGLADSELRFKRHVVSVEPVLEKLAL